MGVAIDILVLLFLAWSLYRGYTNGLLYQLGQMALIILAYFVARGLGDLVAEPLMSALDLSRTVAATLGFFGVFLLIVLIGGLFVRKLTKDLTSFSASFGAADKVLGLVVGGAKGVLIAYIAIVGLIMAHRMTDRVPIPFASSVAGRFVLAHNFLDSDDFPQARALAKLAWVASTRSADEMAADPNVQAILSHPKAQDLMTPEILEAIGRKDYISLLSHDALWAFLEDPEVQRRLDAIPWSEGAPPGTTPIIEAPTP